MGLATASYWCLRLRPIAQSPNDSAANPIVDAVGCLRSERRIPLGANPILVIDPGHGGENAGTRSVLGDRYEKDFTLDWALRLRGIMQAKGWQVYLTRSNDTDLALSNRVAFAADHKAGLFLSLHFNSAGQDTAVKRLLVSPVRAVCWIVHWVPSQNSASGRPSLDCSL